jgi:hypothetical protein
MKLALFSPYGLMDRASGIAYLLANHLAKNGADAVQLHCDGAQPSCARDGLTGGERSPFTCGRCMSEQSSLNRWAGIKAKSISSFVEPADISQASQWLGSVQGQDLFKVEFRGLNIWYACREQFLAQWNLQGGQELTKEREESLKRLFTSYIHTRVASERFLAQTTPTLSLIVRPADTASQAYLAEVREAGKSEYALLTYTGEDESILIECSTSPHRYETRLILDGITSMRHEPRTWPPEVTAILHEILSFLGYAPDRVV